MSAGENECEVGEMGGVDAVFGDLLCWTSCSPFFF